MSSGGPPARPAGWFARLLELGNHNKLVAAATLVTLATGVPYLVFTAVRAVTGGEDAEASMRELLAEALSDSRSELQRQAAEQTLVSLRSEMEAMVQTQLDGLAGLHADAVQLGATPEEERRILAAVQRVALGDLSAALREMERVAREQESRGAVEQAAATWRHRAVLQLASDGSAALADFRRAEDLAPGDAEVTILQGAATYDYESADAALPIFLIAAERARAEGDEGVLATALLEATYCMWEGGPSWDDAMRQRREDFALEALTLLRGLLDPRRLDVEVVYRFGAAALRAMEFGVLDEAPARLSVAADVRDWADRLSGLDRTPEEDPGLVLVARAQLLCAAGVLGAADEDAEDAAAACREGADLLRAGLARFPTDRFYGRRAWAIAYTVSTILCRKDVARYETAEHVARVGMDVLAAMRTTEPRNPGLVNAQLTARFRVMDTMLAREMEAEAAEVAEGAILLVREAMEADLESADVGRFPESLFSAMVAACQAYEHVDPKRCAELASEADSFYREGLAESPWGSYLAPMRANLDGILQRLESDS